VPRTPKFRPVKTKNGWRINIPKTVAASGKREQQFFRSRDEAKEARTRLLENYSSHGTAAAVISPALASDALKAFEILKPWDITLTVAAQMVAKLKTSEDASRPLNEACREWLKVKAAEVRPKTLEGYRAAANKLIKAFANHQLSDIATEDLQSVLAPPETNASSAKANKVTARVFWLWAAERGWCRAEVIQKVKVPKVQDKGEIEILSVAEATRLMEAAEKFYPQSVPMFAIQLFGGIRPEEATRLRPSDFTDAGIELSARITKKGRRRNIEPNDVLKAWLKQYPFQKCPNWTRISRAVRYLAGFKTWVEPGFIDEGIKPLATPSKPWPQNALRHSYASYAVAAGTPLETLLWQFGHTGSPTVLREHYVGRATKKDALAYFSIVPEGVAKPKTIRVA
jgi:integrase